MSHHANYYAMYRMSRRIDFRTGPGRLLYNLVSYGCGILVYEFLRALVVFFGGLALSHFGLV